MRRGVYYPHLYVVKEDGEPPLRLWALSCLIQDRADVLPSYQQFISQLRDKVRYPSIISHTYEQRVHRLRRRSTVRAIKQKKAWRGVRTSAAEDAYKNWRFLFPLCSVYVTYDQFCRASNACYLY